MLALILHFHFLDSNRVFKLFFSLICSFYLGFKFDLLQSGLKKCPDCYGNELCRYFQNQQIQLNWFSCFSSIINPKLTKSVFYGVFNGTDIVIKRKTDRSERPELFNDVALSPNKVQNIIFCPSVGNAQFLYDQIDGGIEQKKLWLDLKSSIEPLLLMYFQTQDKWPFPKYHGACGNLIVEEYKGVPLVNFLSSEFKKKALLGSHLLEMARIFTFEHPDLAFYFTDYSLDNLVVDSGDRIYLIDLDNVIISNKSFTIENNALKKRIHKSVILDEHKYAFSPSDICQHHLSDHNYFSICKYILSHSEDGLLNNIPLENESNRKLKWLLDECSQPKVLKDRFSAGQKLQFLLEEITKDYER